MLFGQFGDRLCPDEELVGAQVLDRLDVQRFLELLGVSLGGPLQRLDGRLRQIVDAVVQLFLVELRVDTSHTVLLMFVRSSVPGGGTRHIQARAHVRATELGLLSGRVGQLNRLSRNAHRPRGL